MKIFFCLCLACLFAAFPSSIFAEEPPSPSRFPVESLAAMRRALDAARGDTAAVEAWLGIGENPDVSGEIESIYSIGKKDLPLVFRALADRAAPEWTDGVLIDRGDDGFLLLYKGMHLLEALSALGLEESYALGYTIEAGSGRYTQHLSKDLSLTNLKDGRMLTSPYGSFYFENAPGKGDGMRPLGTEPLRGWSAQEYEVKVAVHEDEQLSIRAVACDAGNGPDRLILRGIPYFNPLYCAAAFGRVNVIRLLLSRGASLAPMVSGGKTALHAAAEKSQIKAVDALLDAGADIDARTDDGKTPLMAAVEGIEENRAVFRLKDGKDAEGASKDSAWRFSIELREPRYDADYINARDEKREATALRLLSRGADPSLKRGNGETILFAACRRRMPSLLDRLLTTNVDAEIRNDDGETPLFAAIRADQPQALDTLIRYGVSWRYKNPDGETPKDVAKKERARDCLGVLEYQEPFHGSLGAHISLSKATEDGYGWVPGLGAFLDLHSRLSRSLTLTTELEYAIRGSEADPGDPWLVSTEGSPYYEYEHIGAYGMLDFALARDWRWRLSGVAGAGFRFQTSAFIRTDSGAWEPVDICDLLDSTGLCAIVGLGLNGFLPRGTFTGVELRYSRSLGGEWTSQGGGLDSLTLLIRIGS